MILLLLMYCAYLSCSSPPSLALFLDVTRLCRHPILSLLGITKALSFSFSRKSVHSLNDTCAFFHFSIFLQLSALLACEICRLVLETRASSKSEVTRRYRGAGVAIKHSHRKLVLALLPYTQFGLFLQPITNSIVASLF